MPINLAEIELDFDNYGKDARASSLADFLELIALRQSQALRSDLELSLSRGGWHTARRGLFTTDPSLDLEEVEFLENPDGTEDTGDLDWPDWAMAILRQRAAVLGKHYPFDVYEDRLEARPDARDSEYVRLLALSTAHANKASFTVAPETLFELLLVNALRAAGFDAAGMGTATTRGQVFATQLSEAATFLGLQAMPRPYPARAYAKDAGVDAIAVLHWKDTRPGQVIILAQATLAKSSDWQRKIGEPNIEHWADYLNEVLWPIAVLAVPYHVEDENFRYLSNSHRTILDRLRLVGKLGPLVKGEREVLDWLYATNLAY